MKIYKVMYPVVLANYAPKVISTQLSVFLKLSGIYEFVIINFDMIMPKMVLIKPNILIRKKLSECIVKVRNWIIQASIRDVLLATLYDVDNPSYFIMPNAAIEVYGKIVYDNIYADYTNFSSLQQHYVHEELYSAPGNIDPSIIRITVQSGLRGIILLTRNPAYNEIAESVIDDRIINLEDPMFQTEVEFRSKGAVKASPICKIYTDSRGEIKYNDGWVDEKITTYALEK